MNEVEFCVLSLNMKKYLFAHLKIPNLQPFKIANTSFCLDRVD